MSVSREELDKLYELFSSFNTLKTKLGEEATGTPEFVKVLDEVLKLRAEVEKLKANTQR